MRTPGTAAIPSSGAVTLRTVTVTSRAGYSRRSASQSSPASRSIRWTRSAGAHRHHALHHLPVVDPRVQVVGERGRGEVERQLDVHREPRADLLLGRA